MKLNDFEKNYLIKNIYNELIQHFQNLSVSQKNGILGAIQYDNLIDEYGLQDLTTQTKSPSGNAFDGFERLRYYNHLFSNYVELLVEKDNSTIYPSKESFIQNLFIKGEYKLLNFSHASEVVGVSFADGEKGDIAIIGEQLNKKPYSRIRKGLTIRFFDFPVDSHEAFFSGEHLYTITLDKVSDEEFYDLFKASRFQYEHDDYNRYYESSLNQFIKKIIKDGLEYDSTHSDQITGVIPSLLSKEDRPYHSKNGFHFKNMDTGTSFFKDEDDTSFIPEEGLHVGDCVVLNNMNVEIVDIIINSYKEQLICYKKV